MVNQMTNIRAAKYAKGCMRRGMRYTDAVEKAARKFNTSRNAIMPWLIADLMAVGARAAKHI